MSYGDVPFLTVNPAAYNVDEYQNADKTLSQREVERKVLLHKICDLTRWPDDFFSVDIVLTSLLLEACGFEPLTDDEAERVYIYYQLRKPPIDTEKLYVEEKKVLGDKTVEEI